jgi:ADP-ribose pyrophosphatase YjhB (NUDIX family)
MIERVRAVLTTPANTMLAIKRIRPGVEPYWVVPGGGVEPDDPDREAALARELREEIAGRADILGLLYVVTSERDRQFFYLARIEHWSFALARSSSRPGAANTSWKRSRSPSRQSTP